MKIGHRYDAERDRYGWTLTEHVPATTREGGATTRARQSYYGTLEQVLDEIVDREAGWCPKARYLRTVLAEVRQDIRAMLAEHGSVSAPECGGGVMVEGEG